MSWRSILAAAAVAMGVASVHTANAAVLLSDNFDTENGGVGVLNYTGFQNFNVTSGAADLIGNGFFDFYPGNGLYVDVCGSIGTCGVLTTKQTFGPGVYDVTLSLAGNARSGTADTTTVNFGGYSNSYSLSEFQQATETFQVTLASPAQLSIGDGQLINGDVGNILLGVNISSSVPEPAAWSLMLIGLGVLGTTMRSRRTKASAA